MWHRRSQAMRGHFLRRFAWVAFRLDSHIARTAQSLFGLFFLTLSCVLAVATPAHAQDEFLHPDKAFVFSAAMADSNELRVHFAIAPDYYMYRDSFAFDGIPTDALAGPAIFPQGTVTYDPTFERDLEVYHDQVTIRLPLQPGVDQPIALNVTSQGCAEAGLCYPPRTDSIMLVATAEGYRASGKGVVARVPEPQDGVAASSVTRGPSLSEVALSESSGGVAAVLSQSDTGLARVLGGAGWFEIVGLGLLFGIFLTLTPCVLPMVPIVLAVVAGDARSGGSKSRWRGLGLAAAYVFGMSLVYTVLGVLAGLVGASLAVWLQTPWVLVLFAFILVLLALAMFDVFTFQMPVGMQARLNDRVSRIPGGRVGGAFFMGMLSALIVGPCIAAPLAGVLLFISQTGDLVLGGSALFAMAWGQGLLLLLVGATSGALLPRAGEWMNGIKRFFGMLLFATAWWMVGPVVPAWLALIGWAFLAMWGAVMLGAFDALTNVSTAPARPTGAGRALLKAAGLLLALWAALVLIGVGAGGRDMLRPLAPFSLTATVSGSGTAGLEPSANTPVFTYVNSPDELDALLAGTDRPVMLDFYADWCVSCIEMERFTFSDAQVSQTMKQFLLVQADVTKNTPEHRALLKRFDLFGPPGIIFFDAQGAVMPDERVIGFRNAQQFGEDLQRVLTLAKGP